VGKELPTRKLKSILALRAKVREGPGGSGTRRGGVSTPVVSERGSL
jgi:hypothetical protein